MLQVRGVPGTHDLGWCLRAVEAFRSGMALDIPVFSKGQDDRTGRRSIDFSKVDVLLFEGWCWGAKPQAESDLLEPINSIEGEHDADFAI